MGNEWAAERVVDAGLATRLVGRQFPQLSGQPVRELATGWDNTVLQVGAEWVFRFPRRAVALDGVRREVALLPGLAQRLPLAVPVPELVGTPDDEFPWPWWGSRLVPGAELCDAGLADDDRSAVATDIGGFLRVLHDQPLTPEIRSGLTVDPMRRSDMAYRVPWAHARLKTLQQNGIREVDPRALLRLDDASRLPPSTSTPVLLHGDLHLRHVLVDRTRAAGVIDWGDLCLGDPAIDLSLAFGAFVGPARDAFCAAYGPIEPETDCRARALALFLCAALAEYAVDEARPALLAESLAGLDRAVR